MECELCGRSILEGKKVKIEGSILTACDQCSEYGEIIKTVKKKKPVKEKTRKAKKKIEFNIETDDELIEEYGYAIKKARELKHLTQEELAKKINEPISVIKKIESMKYEPNNKIVSKLENKLAIKLKQRKQSKKITQSERIQSRDMTLGDVIVVKKKKRK